MADKFLDFVGLSHFKAKLDELIENSIEKLSQTIAQTYGTKSEVEQADTKAQEVIDAFAQFNQENGIQ